MEQLHFTVNINYLCNLYVQKEYEQLTQTSNYEYKYKFIYPLWDEIQKGYDHEHEGLPEFDKEILKSNNDCLTLTPELLQLYAKWFIENKLKQRPSYIKAVFKKPEQKEDVKTFEQAVLRYNSFVYDKKQKKIYPCGFGDHWSTICDILKVNFQCEYPEGEVNLYDKMDMYIKDNIVLHGNYNPSGYYTLQARGK